MSDEKPPILQDQEFTVEEGAVYRGLRTGAIWMNKLFFSSLFLLAIWLVMGYAGGIEDCADSPELVETENGTVDRGEGQTCSVILTPTAKYLGAMSVVSFLLSIAFGLLGLVVGKRIVEATPARDEAGASDRAARRDTGPRTPGTTEDKLDDGQTGGEPTERSPGEDPDRP